MSQSEFEAKAPSAGKTRVSKSRLVLVLLLIGWENGASFANQSQSVVMQNYSKRVKLLSTLKGKRSVSIFRFIRFLFG